MANGDGKILSVLRELSSPHYVNTSNRGGRQAAGGQEGEGRDPASGRKEVRGTPLISEAEQPL